MKKFCTSTKELAISSAGIIVMACLLIYWWTRDNTANIAGHIAAVAVVLLFCLLCIPFVHKWIEFWDSDFKESVINKEAKTSTLLMIFCSITLTSLMFYLVVYEIRMWLGDTATLSESFGFYINLDTGNYLGIAEYLYDLSAPAAPERIVFYPGYPFLVRAVAAFTGNYLLSAVLVSVLFYSASGCMLYKLLLLDYDHSQAIGAVKYMALLPGGFFFAFPLSESLFIFFCITSIYCARVEKYFLSGAVGALAAFTRSLGVLLVAPIIFEVFPNKEKRVGGFLAACIVPLGTISYLLINYIAAGDPLAFQMYESSHWGQEFGLFFGTAAYQMDNALADLQTDYYTASLGIWIPNLAWCFFSLILMTFATRRIRASYSVYYIAYYVFAIAPTFLISAPRYLVACLSIYPALAELCRYKKIDRILSILCILASLYYIFAFANLWDVY